MSGLFDAFISYGRADSKDFVIKLKDKLTENNLKIWLDLNDIPPVVDWMKQIEEGIITSDNFIFVISPHSVNSPYCRDEIELAIKYNKRIIPVLQVEEISLETWQQRNPNLTATQWEEYREKGLHSSFINLHPQISKINWIYAREGRDNFEEALEKILDSIQKYADYVQQHTRYLVAALEWEKNNRQTNYLLIGEERVKAESWLTGKFHEQPPVIPTDFQAEYICESTKNANNLMTQVFISHVGEDEEIKEKIEKNLRRQGITIWKNKTDIQSGLEFQEEINQGIEGADNFVYLISPASLESKYCIQEIELALKSNKRIIPLLIKATKLEEIPLELRKLQFIDLTGTTEIFQQGISKLINQIKTDEIYYKEHKVLLVKALKWLRQEKNPSILLRGYNLQYYQNWLKTATTKEHPALALHEEFIKVSSGASTEEFLDVFISYSRADSDLARRLNDELQLLGKTTWFDQESIATGVDFQQEIFRGIESCDNFVFIISPKSIKSPYCADEVEHAFMLNKRFITILWKEVETKDLHPALARIQWIDFRQHGGDFYANFSQLMRTLDSDRDHVRNHTKWLSRALDWEKAQKSPDLLLRGAEESVAADWLKEASEKKKQPLITELHSQFISKSREQLIVKRKQEKKQLLILRSLLGGVSAALLFSIGVSWFAIRQKTEAEKQAAIATVREQVSRVKNLLEFKPVEGLVLAISATIHSQEKLQQVLPEAQSSLYEGLEVARESFFLQGHESFVNAVAWNPDGQYLASGSSDDTVKLWSKDGLLLATFKGHESSVNAVAWSPDGQYLASGSDDDTVKLWSKDGEILATLTGHESYVNAVAWSPDGQYLASGSIDNTVKLWSKQGQILTTLTGHKDNVNAVAWSPDGQYLASGSDDDTVKLWSKDGEILATFKGHKHIVRTVAWSPDGEYLASGSEDHTVKLWSKQGQILATLTGHEKSVNSVAWSPDGQYLASGSSDDTVKLWSKGGEILATFKGHKHIVDAVAWSPNGQYLASGSSDDTVKLWSKDGEILATFKGHENSVTSVVWSPDGQYLASGSHDDTVKLWSKDGEILATFKGYEKSSVNSVAWSPDGQYLASGSHDDTVKLWSKDGEILATFKGHEKSVLTVAWSPDGQYLASGSDDDTVKLWSKDGEILATLTGHEFSVTAVAWSPDGQYLASGSLDKTVKVWSKEGQILATFTGHEFSVTAVAWSPDGQHLASGSEDHTVKLWSKDGDNLATFTGHEDNVTAVAWSPDGQYLASGSLDKTVKLWSKEGQLLATLQGHQDDVTSVVWSPDGQYLASGSDDETVKLWRGGDWQNWLETACHRLRLHPALLKPQTEEALSAVNGCLKYGGWSDSEKEEFLQKQKD